jgi:streptogramin lyase
MRLIVRFAIAMAIAGVCVTGSQLPIKIYTTADGLPSNRINKVVLDSRGYLWFCTLEGLSRFDGYGFTNYGPRQGLIPNNINDLLETRTGEYWLATNGGLIRFDPASAVRKFTAFQPDDEPSRSIITVTEDLAGGLWCGTYHGLYRFERTSGGRFRRVEIGMPESGFEPQRTNALLEDRHGVLWIGAESGLYRLFPNGASDRFTTINGCREIMSRAFLKIVWGAFGPGRTWVYAGSLRIGPLAARLWSVSTPARTVCRTIGSLHYSSRPPASYGRDSAV